MVSLDVPLLQMPEAYVGGADKLFDAQGQLTNPSTVEFLKKFMGAFERWVERNAAGA
jgi:chromate reductase